MGFKRTLADFLERKLDARIVKKGDLPLLFEKRICRDFLSILPSIAYSILGVMPANMPKRSVIDAGSQEVSSHLNQYRHLRPS
jgi:hypothetical protein